jgi:hypothetical protein
MFEQTTVRLSAVGLLCGAIVACRANTQYSSGFKEDEFKVIATGHTTEDVYAKIGVPVYAWFSEDDTFAHVDYVAAPTRSLVESKLDADGGYAELRYSVPKSGTDHYYLYYILLKANVVMEKGGPVLQE